MLSTVTQEGNVAGQAQLPVINVAVDDLDDFAAESGMVASTREVPAWIISLGVHL